ncbi:uncharacterized protein LOC112349484 [Selaginella moellendorffii]|uniref:uncharacterized protein LOC112349484 n=1 Tax=Selaginella moellendorffii TaxID=88036 RepID=UPI000D1CF103|nr:uncharacterized protein LOC112349484 [Selaginella moellendorffii]XP_024539745.1 uncharacterized protein LOC112349484 [Selaginella moellendorffii]|eukprot:XP_024539744.1 uncharacterized protein LOC112349484 [Selaginella moellendorffii]
MELEVSGITPNVDASSGIAQACSGLNNIHRDSSRAWNLLRSGDLQMELAAGKRKSKRSWIAQKKKHFQLARNATQPNENDERHHSQTQMEDEREHVSSYRKAERAKTVPPKRRDFSRLRDHREFRGGFERRSVIRSAAFVERSAPDPIVSRSLARFWRRREGAFNSRCAVVAGSCVELVSISFKRAFEISPIPSLSFPSLLFSPPFFSSVCVFFPHWSI